MDSTMNWIWSITFIYLTGFISNKYLIQSSPLDNELNHQRSLMTKPEVTQDSFRVAVFDKAPMTYYPSDEPPSRLEALGLVQNNLDIFTKQVFTAQEEGVKFIIFPEYGLYPSGTSRDTIEPFLESIPDPEKGWNPCERSDLYPDTEIQQALSCLAKAGGMYLMANMGDRVPCDVETDHGCVGGRYQYNTNLAFDPQGKLVARYHKNTLFFEDRYDTPPTPEYSYFDTPFGRIGTLICFDILFYEPAIPLIEHYQVDTIAFPTAWMNVFPYFSAVGFHQSYAYGHSINFLGANLHNPPFRFSGTGLFGFNSTVAFRHDDNSMEAALLIGDVYSRPSKPIREDADFTGIEFMEPDFQSDVFGDMYNFKWLTKQKDFLSVCHNTLCCTLDYERTPNIIEEHFAFGAFRGLHTREGVYYIEVCMMVRCADNSTDNCGDPGVKSSMTHFEAFTVTGNYSTPYRYPQVMTHNLDDPTGSIDPSSGQWVFNGASVTSKGTKNPLISAGVFARRYDLDDPNVTPEPPKTFP